MKNIKITYNPYLIKTSVLIEGKTPKPNSRLNFGKYVCRSGRTT